MSTFDAKSARFITDLKVADIVAENKEECAISDRLRDMILKACDEGSEALQVGDLSAVDVHNLKVQGFKVEPVEYRGDTHYWIKW